MYLSSEVKAGAPIDMRCKSVLMCDGKQFVGLTARLHRTTRLGDGCLKRRPYVSVAFAMSEWLEVLEII